MVEHYEVKAFMEELSNILEEIEYEAKLGPADIFEHDEAYFQYKQEVKFVQTKLHNSAEQIKKALQELNEIALMLPEYDPLEGYDLTDPKRKHKPINSDLYFETREGVVLTAEVMDDIKWELKNLPGCPICGASLCLVTMLGKTFIACANNIYHACPGYEIDMGGFAAYPKIIQSGLESKKEIDAED